ncbi:MAG: glycerate kinase [Lewinella sp.]|jgi:glycerate kinase|nr:glycerate kinase [Lewinella sp.]
MKVLIAPDKFKGTLSAAEVAAAIARAVRKVYPEAEIIQQPMADGGEGSLELLASALPTVQRHRLEVTGPLRKPVLAEYLLSEGKAYIEIAEACGLKHVPVPRRDPGLTTTIGVGQLIDDAIARGATDIYLFLGGSATNDAASGMAAALGYRFFSNRPEDFVPTGSSLRYVSRIDTEEVLPGLKDVRFTAVCDVDNVLLGPEGATYTYALQKGATETDLPALEASMAHFAQQIRTCLNADVNTLTSGGAAGGLAAGASAFLGAKIRTGTDVLMEVVGFDTLLKEVDLLITGEGKIDAQTLHGKVVNGVAQRARAAGVPKVIALCGRSEITPQDAAILGVDNVHALLDLSSITLEDAMYRTADSLERLVAIRMGKGGELGSSA